MQRARPRQSFGTRAHPPLSGAGGEGETAEEAQLSGGGETAAGCRPQGARVPGA